MVCDADKTIIILQLSQGHRDPSGQGGATPTPITRAGLDVSSREADKALCDILEESDDNRNYKRYGQAYNSRAMSAVVATILTSCACTL